MGVYEWIETELGFAGGVLACGIVFALVEFIFSLLERNDDADRH